MDARRRPVEDRDYKRGYLTGMIRGDGTVGSYTYPRAGRRSNDVHRFRLALADDEALIRSQRYLDEFEVETDRFVFAAATSRHREVHAVRTQRRAGVERIRELIEWPLVPSLSWTKGFLAGIFDAEGSSNDAIRIANADPDIIEWVATGLDVLGFDT